MSSLRSGDGLTNGSCVVDEVGFDFYSADAARKLSVQEIYHQAVFNALHVPNEGSLYDPHLGPIDDGTACMACGLSKRDCRGHMGHIELVVPVFHPLLFNLCVRFLRAKCFACHRFKGAVAVPKHVGLDGKARIGLLQNIVSQSLLGTGKACQWCQAHSPAVRVIEGRVLQNRLSMSAERINLARGIELANVVGRVEKREYVDGSAVESSGPDEADEMSDSASSLPIEDSRSLVKNSGSSGQHPRLLTPLECREHLRLLWKAEELAFSSVPDAWKFFFLDTLLVPPNNFRPPMRVGDSDSLYDHPQNSHFRKILAANLRLGVELKDGGAVGRDGDPASSVGASPEAAPKILTGEDFSALEGMNDSLRLSRVCSGWNELQKSVKLLFDNTSKTDPGLRQQLEKKDGLFRRYMMGKRVNFAARSVISPDPYIGGDEIGLPEVFALTLTYPERVTPWNERLLRRAVENGAEKHPGANFLELEPGVMINLKSRTRQQREALSRTLMVPHVAGESCAPQVVHRHLMNGDYVLVNRQPTLHKPSIMAHRARVLLSEKSIRMHYVNCSTYNADFDGDEINVHLPQSEMARAEARTLVATDAQYFSPASGNPLRGLIQDHVVGGVLLTKRDTFLEKEVFQELLFVGCTDINEHLPLQTPPPAFVKPKILWTGKQLVSSLLMHVTAGLPPLSLESKTKMNAKFWGTNAEEEAVVRFVDNYLVHGVVEKSQYGASSFGLAHAVNELYGPQATGRLLTAFGRLFSVYLQRHGFTCGVDDLQLTAAANASRTELIAKAEKIGTQAGLAFVGMAKPSDNESSAEDQLLGSLGQDAARDPAKHRLMRVLRSATSGRGRVELDGRMRREMAKCTSDVIEACFAGAGAGPVKSFPHNSFALMTQCGAKGSIVNYSQVCCLLGQQDLEGRRVPVMPTGKTLPCFMPYDLSPQAGGYVGDRFWSGVRPQSYYFHCMAGREGLVDTAVKTSRSGYLQRCLVKNLESLRVHYDGSVRDADHSLIQFSYGEDRLDVARAKWLPQLKFFGENSAALLRKLWCEASEAGWDAETLVGGLSRPDKVSRSYKKLVERYIAEDPDRIFGGRSTSPSGKRRRRSRSSVGVDGGDAVLHRSRRVPKGKKALPPELFRWLVRRNFRASSVHAGEAVGLLAAQSIGEPSTQMTLNSVDWNTTMALHWTGAVPPPAPHDAEVGAFIDALIDERPDECQLQPDGKTVYLPLPPGTAVALSPDEDGNMMWTELEAVTRHPPINKDGSNTLVEVKTDSGRAVIVTKGKSLLVEREGRLVEINGDKVVVADRVPVVQELPEADGQETLNLHTVFCETEAVFTNTMIEAMEAAEHNLHWFPDGGFKAHSCYTRSDFMCDAVRQRPELLEADRVVLPHGGNFFPMHVPLDRDFGFFVGAYLAEGCVTDDQVHITNFDPNFRDAARVWPERHGIRWHVNSEKDQHRNVDTSISVSFRSTILVQLMVRTCGKLSAEKRVPGFAFAAPDDFLRGLLDGYMSGNGLVSKTAVGIRVSSRSQKLRDGIALLLTRFGIGCQLSQHLMMGDAHCATEDDGTRPQTGDGEETLMYYLHLRSEDMRRFAANFDPVLAYKQSRCEEILPSDDDKHTKCYEYLRKVRLEEVIALRDVESSHEFVYDLTVAKTRNMVQIGGIAIRDTFHLAGFGRANVTLGIPRLREILIVATTNPSSPSMRLPLLEGRTLVDAQTLAARLSRIRVRDVVNGVEVREYASLLECAGSGVRNVRVRMCEVLLEISSAKIRLKEVTEDEVFRCVKHRYAYELRSAVRHAVLREYARLGVRHVRGSHTKRPRRLEEEEEEGSDEAGGEEAGAGSKQPRSTKLRKRKKGRSVIDFGSENSDEDGDERDEGEEGEDGDSSDEEEEPVTGAESAGETTGAESSATGEATSGSESELRAARGVGKARLGQPGLIHDWGQLENFESSRTANGSLVIGLKFAVPGDVKILVMSIAEKCAEAATVRSAEGIVQGFASGDQDKPGSFVVETEGSNLDVAAHFGDMVDLDRLYTNDIAAILAVYGVEAARSAIVREVSSVFSNYGIQVDTRHLGLIADFQTFGGKWRSLNHIGMAENPSPLLKMSFERTTQVLRGACLGGEVDVLATPSAKLVLGRPPVQSSFELVWPLNQ